MLARYSSDSTLQCVCIVEDGVKAAKDLDVVDGILFNPVVVVFNALAFRFSNTGPLVSLKEPYH